MLANIGATPGAYPGIVTEAQAADGIGRGGALGVIEGLGDRVAVGSTAGRTRKISRGSRAALVGGGGHVMQLSVAVSV